MRGSFVSSILIMSSDKNYYREEAKLWEKAIILWRQFSETGSNGSGLGLNTETTHLKATRAETPGYIFTINHYLQRMVVGSLQRI